MHETTEHLSEQSNDELQRQCELVLDLADEEVRTRCQCARNGQPGSRGMREVQELEADVNAVRPHVAALPQTLELLREAVTQWPQFESDNEVSGGDLVEWFAAWRCRVKGQMQTRTQQRLYADERWQSLLDRGFVILTINRDSEADRQFEAWAYVGPLNFIVAAPICFGLGADPVDALRALHYQLADQPEHHGD